MVGLLALCADYFSPAKQWALDHHLAVLQALFHVVALSRDDLLVVPAYELEEQRYIVHYIDRAQRFEPAVLPSVQRLSHARVHVVERRAQAHPMLRALWPLMRFAALALMEPVTQNQAEAMVRQEGVLATAQLAFCRKYSASSILALSRSRESPRTLMSELG